MKHIKKLVTITLIIVLCVLIAAEILTKWKMTVCQKLKEY